MDTGTRHTETKLCFDGGDGNSPGTQPGEMIARTEMKETADVRKFLC